MLGGVEVGRVRDGAMLLEWREGVGVVEQLKAVNKRGVFEEKPEVKGGPADCHGGAGVVKATEECCGGVVGRGQRDSKVG